MMYQKIRVDYWVVSCNVLFSSGLMILVLPIYYSHHSVVNPYLLIHHYGWWTSYWNMACHLSFLVGSKSGVLWPLNWNHFLTPVLVSQDPIKKNERGYPSRFFWLFEILAILEVVTSSDTHVPLFRNILVRTWGCRISLDSEWWEEAENVYVNISRYWKSRYKCENASKAISPSEHGDIAYRWIKNDERRSKIHTNKKCGPRIMTFWH